MSNITEKLLKACNGVPAKIAWPHRLLHEAHAEIMDLREESKTAEAEILRLREGLRRCKDYTDIDLLNKFIDKLLKIQKTDEF